MEQTARRSFHIGRYHCTETLSQGPLGETFRAKVYGVAGLEKQYALKQIDASLRVDPDVRHRLVDAARRYATLEHDRIARLTEIQDDDDALFLVTELARGIDLPRLLAHLRGRSETLPIEQAILVAADVAEALEVAQRPSQAATAGVLHLGLHPAVVSVLGEGEVRVADFAIASALERPGWADDDALRGLLAYTAPERLDGPTASAASDTWSLGAILFELCAGVPLLGGETAAALRVARGALPWDKLPARAGLRELLERMLSVDPASRPQHGAAVREQLAGLLGLELTRARAGLQALVKRALGRTMTRTGSFAAVAIPSVSSIPTLVQESPSAAPPQGGPRTLLGMVPLAKAAPPEPAPAARGWAPPRTAAHDVVPAMPIPKIPTLPGLGTATPDSEPPQMEMAELPPTSEVTVTERSMEAVAFDEDGVTAPHGRLPGAPPERPEEGIDALEGEPLELDVHDLPTRHGMPPIPAAAFPSRPMSSVPDPASAASAFSEQTTLGGTGETTFPDSPVGEVQLGAPPADVPPPGDAAVAPPEPPMSVPAIATPLVVSAGLPVSPSLTAPPPLTPTERGTVGRANTLPAPAQPQPRTNGAWLAGGLVGLAIAIGVVVAVEHGGGSSGPREEAPKIARTEPTPIEAPKVEAPKIEAPKVETPKVEAPKIEAPKVETPKVETPKVEAPKVEAPKIEAPKVEAPKVEAPKVEAPAPAAGQLSITTTPPGATVWIDGEARGQAPLGAPLPAGKHRVSVVLQGMKLVQKNVTVEAEGTSLAIALEPARLPAELGNAQGGLKVRCRTQGELRILVDGHDTGLSCPNNDRINVEPGEHKIGLLSPRTGEVKELDGEIEDDPDHSTRIYVRY